jgi:hypothetical protein
MLLHVTESKLKTFCFRLFDAELGENEWLESLGSLLALRPPSKWRDADEDLYDQELADASGRFKRAESVSFKPGKGDKDRRLGVRVAVTQADGTEKQEVVHFSSDEEGQIHSLQDQLSALITKNKRLGLAAASRAIWSQLKSSEESS